MRKLNVASSVETLARVKRPFGPPLAIERQEILIAEVHGELIKIGLDGDGRAGAEIKRLGARCIRKLAKIRLCSGGEKESAPPVSGVWSIDGPNINILLFARG